MNRSQSSKVISQNLDLKTKKTTDEMETEFGILRKKIIKYMNSYKFSAAFGDLYEFIWHRFADFYIEQLKEAVTTGDNQTLETLEKVYLNMLIMIHPFMPYVTESIWQIFNGSSSSILESKINVS